MAESTNQKSACKMQPPPLPPRIKKQEKDIQKAVPTSLPPQENILQAEECKRVESVLGVLPLYKPCSHDTEDQDDKDNEEDSSYRLIERKPTLELQPPRLPPRRKIPGQDIQAANRSSSLPLEEKILEAKEECKRIESVPHAAPYYQPFSHDTEDQDGIDYVEDLSYTVIKRITTLELQPPPLPPRVSTCAHTCIVFNNNMTVVFK